MEPIAKVSWDWLSSPLIQKTISFSPGEAEAGSVSLRHLYPVAFRILPQLFQLFGAAWRFLNKTNPNMSWNTQGFPQTFHEILDHWNWLGNTPGTWKHAEPGVLTHPLPTVEFLQQQLRASFRTSMWNHHHQSGRPDAFSESRYHADFCRWDRKQSDCSPSAIISPACFSVTGTDIALCFVCLAVANTVEHAWVCSC